MFSQIIVLATVALSVVAGTVSGPNGSKYTCNTDTIQCCNQQAKAGSQNAAAILSAVGIAAQGITGLVGAQCSPITVIGTGSGANCVTAPLCCDKNQIKGAVAIGCSPAAIGA